MTGQAHDRPPRRGRLRDLRIRNLGVIDDALIEFTDGLNVLTGETGAGKTMVVNGLGLLLGARGDSSLVRAGAAAVVVEGSVDLPAEHPAIVRAAEAGGDTEDGLLLARTVGAGGRSKAYVGGRQAPLSVLADVGHQLVAVHGQADQWRLRRADQHRSLLDGFGGTSLRAAVRAYHTRYDEAVQVRAELARLEELDRDRLVQGTVLRAGLEALEALDPKSGEDVTLAQEEERLAYVDTLRAAAVRAHALLAGDTLGLSGGISGGTSGGFGTGYDGGYGAGLPDPAATGPGAAELLALARSTLSQAAQHDPALAGLSERVAELAYLATDVGTEVAGYLDQVEGDPNRLAWVQQRRADLTRLCRAYGGSVDAALAWGAQAVTRLDQLESVADRIEDAQHRLCSLNDALGTAAAELSHARQEAATRLAHGIAAELAQLAMPQAVVEVDVTQVPAPQGEPGLRLPGRDHPQRFGPHGVDDVEIKLAANPGTLPRTVAKAASGGELSRVMLAIEVVTQLAGSTDEDAGESLTTFVFDEVDAGVGGAAALAIGARLASLAQHTQVVVVTHLAQVAAYADRHITIRKSSPADAVGQGTDGAEVTTSDLSVLDEDGRLRELARMMAGSADSDVAIEHARELLSNARRTRETVAAPEGS